MAIILPNQKLVLNAYAVLVGETPGNAALNEHLDFITANGTDAYVAALNSIFADMSDASLATTLLANLGLSSIFTQAEAEAFLAGNASNRVGAMINLANALFNYSGSDAAIVAAHDDYVNAINGSYNYSIDSSNVAGADLSGSVVSGGQTLTLTVDQDTLTGTSGDDTFVAGVSNVGGTLTDTLQGIDSLNGGAGTDTLNATLNSGTATAAPALSAIENLIIRSTAAGSGLDLSGSTGIEMVKVASSTATAAINGVGAIASLAVANQNKDVSFDASTATTLAVSLDTVGVVSTTAPTEVAIDLGAVTASKATTLNISVNNSNVELKDTAGGSIATAATIAATGTSEVTLTDGASTLTSLTVTGAGSVKVSEVALTKVATLTVGDGGITFTTGDSTATTFSATTGAGKDTLTVDGAVVKTISTGAGNDKVTTATAALVATASIDLGDGDDTLVLHAAPAGAGVTLAGGAGTDTLATTYASYNTISTYGATDLAKITGFETLSITGAALADTNTVDLSKLSGLTSAQILGVATTGAASITNVGANSSVVIKGDMQAGADDGSLTISLKDSTGTADVLNLTIDQAITQNNDGTVETFTSAITGITASGVETLNFTSTGTLSTAVTTGNKTDVAVNGLSLTDTALTTLNVSGDQGFTFTSAAGMTKLATIDLSANTAGGTVSVAAAATDGTAAAITVTGSAGADTITGSGNVDVISGGAGADTITGGAKADTLSGGAGNDTFILTAGTDSTLANMDVISDFSANTYGNGTNGAAGTGAGADSTKWTGDVLKVNVDTGTITKVDSSVQTNAADALTFIQNVSNSTTDTMAAALDSSTGKLYIDLDSDGVVDSVVQLTGVTTITEAAFVLY